MTTAALASMLAIVTPLQLFSGNFLELAILFFVLALVAALLGARGAPG